MERPEHLEYSLCLPIQDGRRELRRQTVISYIAVLGPMALFGVVPALLYLLEEQPEDNPAFLSIAVLCMVLGAGLIFNQSKIRRELLRARLQNRPGSLLSRRHSELLMVSIEDTQTVEVTKVEPEDCGICAIEPAERRLLIEGCAYRYIIRGEDVVFLAARAQSAYSGVDFCYRVDELELWLRWRPGSG
jgi:hypothetical protein